MVSADIILECYLISKAILLGVSFCLTYDILRIFRRVIHRNAIMVAIEDTIYWCVAGVFAFMLLYDYNGGVVRIHAFIFVALGMLLYWVSLSAVIVKYISLLLLKIKFMLVKVLKNVIKKVKINKAKKSKDARTDEQKSQCKKKKIE